MAVWILGSLMRGGMEERQRQQGRPNANNGPDRARPAPQRPANDLESFLREVHRRRQTAEPPPPEPERAESRPKPRPAPPPRRQPRPAPPPATRRPEPRRNVDEPVAVEVVRVQELPPAVLPVPPSAAFPAVAEVVVPFAAAPLAAPPPAPRPAVKRPPPALAGLLDSPAALRKAIILREIFDPPLCKRRR
jgi:hypothetical protein